MPIYAYRCAACGHARDMLQKISDPVLTVCPACGASAFEKQVTAAGFQLKGSGWYATDFRGGTTGAPKAENDEKAASDTAKPATDKPAEKAADTPAASTPPAAPPPAAGG